MNALSFSKFNGTFIASGYVLFTFSNFILTNPRSDDKRVLLWSTFKRKAIKQFCGHEYNVFCVIFDHDNSHLLSCAGDGKILRYDIETSPSGETSNQNFSRGGSCDEYLHHPGILYKISLAPTNSNLLASAGDNRSISLFDIRTKRKQLNIEGIDAFTSVEFHPFDNNKFISSNSKQGLQEWDLRTISDTNRNTRCLNSYNTLGFNNVCGASYSSDGKYIGASVSKSFPMLFQPGEKAPIYIMYDPSYKNSCTLKSFTFGMNDKFVISGSDDFNIYLWDLPECLNDPRQIDTNYIDYSALNKYQRTTLREVSMSSSSDYIPRASHILEGHRSIVNNIISHPVYPLLCSTGVEKILKLWSPYPIHSQQTEIPPPQPRRTTLNDNFRMMLDYTSRMQANDNDETTEESPSTLLLFDYFNLLENSDDTDAEYELNQSDDEL